MLTLSNYLEIFKKNVFNEAFINKLDFSQKKDYSLLLNNTDLYENFELRYQQNERFLRFFNKIDNEEEKQFIVILAYYQYYIMLKRESKKKLIKQCDTFLNTSICKRNLQLKRIVELEIAQLKFATDFKFIDIYIKSLNAFYSGRYPNFSKIERAVKISEALNHLSIYERKPFMSLEQANIHAYENALKSGRKIIYGRLKNYLK